MGVFGDHFGTLGVILELRVRFSGQFGANFSPFWLFKSGLNGPKSCPVEQSLTLLYCWQPLGVIWGLLLHINSGGLFGSFRVILIILVHFLVNSEAPKLDIRADKGRFMASLSLLSLSMIWGNGPGAEIRPPTKLYRSSW